MSIVIGVGQHSMAIQNGEVEIANFRQYRIYQEGNRTPITGFDDLPKNLKLVLSNGVVEIIITPSNNSAATIDKSTMLKNYVPQGYELVDTQEASKVIKGVRGKYYYYYNKDDGGGKYLALVTRGSGRPGRISLGGLQDRSSTLYQVLDKLPKDRPFHKAELNSLLPAKIVENRQPIKAALDILEREGFVKKTGNRIGISEEYVRSDKATPVVGLDRHVTLDDHLDKPE
ncbi:MAG: hypothetical protein ABI347_04535 [Nitrososphaera sp.]|jgi:hypothetical protein